MIVFCLIIKNQSRHIHACEFQLEEHSLNCRKINFLSLKKEGPTLQAGPDFQGCFFSLVKQGSLNHQFFGGSKLMQMYGNFGALSLGGQYKDPC